MSYKQFITKKYQIDTEKTAKYVVHGIFTGADDEPLHLEGIFAGTDYNKKLKNARDRKYGSRKLTEESKAEMVIDLYPKYVFTGWNLKDKEDNPVPYDEDMCRDMLADLKDDNIYIFADIIQYMSEFTQFEIEKVTEEDGVKVGNESGETSNGVSQTKDS